MIRFSVIRFLKIKEKDEGLFKTSSAKKESRHSDWILDLDAVLFTRDTLSIRDSNKVSHSGYNRGE